MTEIFILTHWTVINMSDWVEESIAVSESKDRLIEYHGKIVGATSHLVDRTDGKDFEQYCKGIGLNNYCIDDYYSIDRIVRV